MNMVIVEAAHAEVREALNALVTNGRYQLRPVTGHNPNALATWQGRWDGNEITVTEFPAPWAQATGWFGVTLAFGQVRHVWENHTPLGEFGIAHASSHYTFPGVPDTGGQAIAGYALEGLKYRVGGCAPQGRTAVIEDRYIQCPDIIEYLLQLREACAAGQTGTGDLTRGLWEKAQAGW